MCANRATRRGAVWRGGPATRRVLMVLAIAVAFLMPASAASAAGSTTLVSVSTGGVPGNGHSAEGNISADGRFVVFSSGANTMTPDDPDLFLDVFVRDLATRTTTLVSVSSNGTKGNRGSFQPFISDNGRYVLFASDSTNLVPGVAPGGNCAFQHVYLRDLQAGTTDLVSQSTTGSPANCLSDAGTVSADGRFVLFFSSASNLVSRDRNGATDAFLRDRQTGTTTRVSLSSDGREGNGSTFRGEISSDGRFVVFVSTATNLTNNDANGTAEDVFIRNLQTGTTRLVSVSTAGVQANNVSTLPAIGSDGRFVAFTSFGSNLVPNDTNGAHDVFVRDLVAGTTQRVSLSSSGAQANHNSAKPDITPDGRFVSFQSQASNLVPNDTNPAFNEVFLRDRVAGTTVRASVSSLDEQANSFSYSSSVSNDGRRVAFSSGASNLAPGDANTRDDVFLHEPGSVPPADTTAPTVSVTDPVAGSTVSGTQTVSASATDDVGVVQVRFFVDGTLIGTDSAAPYAISWETTTVANGSRALSATAADAAGNTGTSASVTVTVDNTAAAPALASLTLNPTSVTGGNPSTGTVTLDRPAPTGGVSIALASSNTAAATVPASVIVAPGSTSASFTVSTTTASTNTSSTISATLNGITRTAVLTVTSPATDTVSISRAEYEAAKNQLRVEATSSNATATLTVFVTATDERIGTLAGGRGEFTWPTNPQNITVRSSLGGSAARVVQLK
jgi:hypothetical protein